LQWMAVWRRWLILSLVNGQIQKTKVSTNNTLWFSSLHFALDRWTHFPKLPIRVWGRKIDFAVFLRAYRVLKIRGYLSTGDCNHLNISEISLDRLVFLICPLNHLPLNA
jgi:hypothetical protein